MPKINNYSEKLADRLVDIIRRLNMGESFTCQELAQQYKVSEKTIQRDIARLSSLGIQDIGRPKKYFLEKGQTGKFDEESFQHFSQAISTDKLLPNIKKNYLDKQMRNENLGFTVKHRYQDLKDIKEQFNKLQDCINDKAQVIFYYIHKKKTYQVEPYKLVNHNDIWYLAAKHENKIKNFLLSKIDKIQKTFIQFEVEQNLLKRIEQEESVWHKENKVEIIIKIKAEVSQYFTRRSLLPEQKTVKQLDNGELIISTMISHKLELFPIIRYWIPNLTIISPEDWQQELEMGLREYLGK